VKLPDVYTDWKIVVGFALIMLGAANWTVGLARTQTYSRMIAARSKAGTVTDYRSFDELEAGAGGAVLAPFSEREHQMSYATARMDFYHAAFLTGRVMLLLGVMLMLAGFIGVIQRDSRRQFQRPREPFTPE
jgi:uncharacterized membrane protein